MSAKNPLMEAAGGAITPVVEGAPLIVALVDIDEDPGQPRQEFDADQLQELTDSIAVAGIKQPLLVRPQGDGRYLLVDGARRFRAAAAAGLLDAPCVVTMPASWLTIKQDQLITNAFRQDLTALERAQTLEMLWLGHQIAALEAEQQDDSDDTRALLAEAETPAQQIAMLRDRLCELAQVESRDAYLASGAQVRVSWDAVLKAVGLSSMTADRRKKLLSVLDLSVAAQDALAGVPINERTLRDLANRPADEQAVLIAEAQASDGDVGTALREALHTPVAQQPATDTSFADWESGAPEAVLSAPLMGVHGGIGGMLADADPEFMTDERPALALDVDGEGRSDFVPDPTLAMPFFNGKGQKLVSERGAIGRGSTPPAGHDLWTEDQALKLSGLLEGLLNLLDEVGPAYVTEQHKGWLLPMWTEALGRLQAAGLEVNPG